jgi:DNA-binding response OmpR family regulator
MYLLIADGDSESREDIRSNLYSFQPDWKVLTTDSAKECLNIIKNGDNLDAVILSMNLSDMSSLSLSKFIREYSDLPIIVMSLNKDIHAFVKALDSGASDYIVYPFNEQIFIARLKALVRRRNWDIQARKRKMEKATDKRNGGDAY